MKNEFLMAFSGGGCSIELVETQFCSEVNGYEVLQSIRGKTCGAYRGAATFQWTSAVKGITALMVGAKLSELAPNRCARIVGMKGSYASSLDYAISKGTIWLEEMFGNLANGDLVAKRLFLRTNPNMKRPGPVVISVNARILPKEAISVFLDGKIVTSIQVLENIVGSIDREAIVGYRGYVEKNAA